MRNPLQTMEEQWLKNNTDCIYFLASPLTCKKGIECEYRHSEFARLNPVDCWYWLSGTCLNENCGYRHPPLDGPAEESLEPANMFHQTPGSIPKSNIPCRYFLNGYCNKGESCLYLHGPCDNDIQESMETVSAVMNQPAIDRKNVGNDISSDAPILTHANAAVTCMPAIDKAIATGGDTRSAIPIAIHANPSTNTNRLKLNTKIAMGNDTRHGGAPVIADVDLSENYTQKREGIDVKPVNILQSTTRNVSRQIPVPQSPGLLFQENTTRRLNPPLRSRESIQRTSHSAQRSGDQVEDYTEQVDWGSSPGCFNVQVNLDDPDGFPREYEDVDLNLRHPDAEYHYYDSSDNDISSIHANETLSHVTGRSLEIYLSHKRNFTQTRLSFGSNDLRHVLKKRKLSNEKKRYQQAGFRRLQGRLASKIVNDVGSQIGRGSFWKSSYQQRRQWQPRTSKPSQHFTGGRGKQPFKPRKSKPAEEIRERREPLSGTAEEDFQGPKPLSEILKEKRTPRSEDNGYH